MADLFPLFLFAHILAAIVAFGPTFAIPIMASMAAGEPQVRPFLTRVNLRLSTWLILPFALSLWISGALMIIARGYEFGSSGTRWLELAIGVYAISSFLALVVGLPNTRQIVRLVQAGPPGPDGPPAELLRRIRRAQLLGYLLTVLFLTVLALMVFKPTLG
jgi:uncharacterized membrane protein